MGVFKIISLTCTILAILFAYKVHHQIPSDCPDHGMSQLCTDLIYFCEAIASCLENFNILRWHPFYASEVLQTIVPNENSHLEVSYLEFANVRSVVVKPKGIEHLGSGHPAIVYYHGGGWVLGSIGEYL